MYVSLVQDNTFNISPTEFATVYIFWVDELFFWSIISFVL